MRFVGIQLTRLNEIEHDFIGRFVLTFVLWTQHYFSRFYCTDTYAIQMMTNLGLFPLTPQLNLNLYIQIYVIYADIM